MTELYDPFPPELLRTLDKGGKQILYIPVSEVIHRLNECLGADLWSMEIIRCERDKLDPDFIVAHVRLSIITESGRTVIKDGVGGQKIKRTKEGQIIDLGDEFKGAVSDALKKAAQTIGVGLYLARGHQPPAQQSQVKYITGRPGEATTSNKAGTLTVRGTQHGPLPEWVFAAAKEQGIVEVYDNRDSIAGTRRPAFKCTASGVGLWEPRTKIKQVKNNEPPEEQYPEDEEPF